MNELTELLQTVEEVRAAQFPTLPSTLVQQLLTTEAEYLADRREGASRVSTAVDTYVRESER